MLMSANQTDLDCMSIVKVLVISEKHWIALDLKYRLQRLGYKTIAASENLTNLMTHEQPDLVLIDRQKIESEIVGAIEAAEIPIVCFDSENQFCEMPIDLPCLTNPYQETVLNTVIREALRQHQTQVKLVRQLDSNQKQRELFHTVDHELRTPMSTMLITLDWIELMEQEELSARSLQKLDHLAMARSSVQRMAEFLDRASLFCRCQSGKLSLKPSWIDLSTFCKTLVLEVEQLYANAEIQLINLSLRSMIEFDEMVLRQILLNLLSNAVKYSEREVYFNVDCRADQLIFKIQDQGIGISERDRESIFTPMYRGSNVETIPGSGMGLAIVQQLVSACGGSITVDSTLNQGSTFTVVLPLQS
ncbi:response regulator receiver sensor signal transduction histidine kinase [Leptolyngbya sp. NIES-3755]|nr:response regulator receiver sensor signal transduction histidine kinase [Leptolyngbya sp. NIES-3755]